MIQDRRLEALLSLCYADPRPAMWNSDSWGPETESCVPANFKIALDHREHSEAQTEPVARSDGSVCRRWWTVAWVVRPTLGVASSWPQGSAHHNTTWFHVYVAVLRVIHGRCFLSASSFYFITKWDWRGFFHLPPLIKRPRLLCPSWDRAVWQAVWTDRVSPRRPPAPPLASSCWREGEAGESVLLCLQASLSSAITGQHWATPAVFFY